MLNIQSFICPFGNRPKVIDQIKDLIYGFTVEHRFSDRDCPYIVRAEYECFQIELSKNYGFLEWREDIKSIMLKAGLQNVQITFLFVGRADPPYTQNTQAA